MKETLSTRLRVLNGRSLWAAAICALYLTCVYAFQPTFFTPGNLGSVLYYTCLLVPAALGVHLLIVLGLIDLSVGAVAAASAIMTAQAVSYGVAFPLAFTLGLLTGSLLGFLNWLVVSRFGISALIGTLIIMGLARAIAVGITEGQTLSGLPSWFGKLAQGHALGLPNAVVLGLALVMTLEALSDTHIIFRRLYQTGSNRRAALDNGINVSRLELIAFVLTGLGAAVVGLLQSSRTLSASPHGFPDLALDCIAACVIGGDNLAGGSGRALGSFLGLLMVAVSRNLVVLAGVNVYWQDLAVAIVLLAAVLTNKLRTGD
jgi:ribose transport system permease protein